MKMIFFLDVKTMVGVAMTTKTLVSGVVTGLSMIKTFFSVAKTGLWTTKTPVGTTDTLVCASF